MVSAVQRAHATGQNKVGIVPAHIARSVVNNDAMIMINKDVDVEDEESEEEYRDDVVLEEISDDNRYCTTR